MGDLDDLYLAHAGLYTFPKKRSAFISNPGRERRDAKILLVVKGKGG